MRNEDGGVGSPRVYAELEPGEVERKGSRKVICDMGLSSGIEMGHVTAVGGGVSGTRRGGRRGGGG